MAACELCGASPATQWPMGVEAVTDARAHDKAQHGGVETARVVPADEAAPAEAA